MKLSNKKYNLLTKEESDEYLLNYLQEILDLSIRKTQSSDSYELPAWGCYQAEQIGIQKAVTKIIKMIK